MWFHGVGVEGEAEGVLGPLRGDDGVVAGDGAELGVGFDGLLCLEEGRVVGRGLWLDERLVFDLELFLDSRFSSDGKFSP